MTVLLSCFPGSESEQDERSVPLSSLVLLFTEFTPWLITDDTLFKLGLDPWEMFVLLLGVLVLLTVSILQERGVHMRETIARQNLAFRWAVYIVAIFAVLLLGIYGPGYNAADFVYANF